MDRHFAGLHTADGHPYTQHRRERHPAIHTMNRPSESRRSIQIGHFQAHALPKNALPAKQASTRPATSSDAPTPSCAICFDPIKPAIEPSQSPCTLSKDHREYPAPGPENSIVVVVCGHVFGDRCLSRWMDMSNTCPLCRLEFFREEGSACFEHDFFDSWRGITEMSGLAIDDGGWESDGDAVGPIGPQVVMDDSDDDVDADVKDAVRTGDGGQLGGAGRRGAIRTFFG